MDDGCQSGRRELLESQITAPTTGSNAIDFIYIKTMRLTLTV